MSVVMRSLPGDGTPLSRKEAVAERTLALMAGRSPRSARFGAPWVTLSYAQSLDGCIAAKPGAGTAISNDAAQVVTHQLRAAHDGILVGINTVLVDDPRLTVRHAPGRDPRPIVVDSRARLPLSARLLDRSSRPPIVATLPSASEKRRSRLESNGVEVLPLPANRKGGVDLRALLRRLPELGVQSVMIEGGARIISGVLAERLADQLVLTISPMILGGVRAVESLDVQGASGALPPLSTARWHWADGNLLLQGELPTRK